MRTLLLLTTLAFGHDLFNDPFFNPRNILKTFQQIEKEIEESFFPDFEGNFSRPQITKREDKEFKYIEIFGKDFSKEGLKVKVRGNFIYLSAKTLQKKETHRKEIRSSSHYESFFQQTFSVPQNVDSSKVEYQVNNGKIILKFPKDNTVLQKPNTHENFI